VEVLDQLTEFPAPAGQPPYRPANYEDKYFGRVTLRDALGNSLNVPAVKVLQHVGVPALQEMAGRLGITTLGNWNPEWLSLTLGGGEVRLLELTGAYATIARLGEQRAVEPLVGVETSRRQILHQAAESGSRQVVDPRVAYQLLHVMGDPGARLVTFGPNTPLNLGRPHLVKTGTTDDYRDTWTLGCVPQVCVGVWMGNTDNQPMRKTSSSLTAGKVWVDLMGLLVERYGWEPVSFPRPDGLEVVQVPTLGGARPGQQSYEEVFLPGQQRRYALEQAPRRPTP
jgi:membrane peptidoglycan carboxypeptidase